MTTSTPVRLTRRPTLRSCARLLPLALLALAGGSAAGPATPVGISAPRVPITEARPAVDTPVHGVYVEARTASVFAGACHYNGERVTDGRSAIMAWHIDGGSFDGVDLTGTTLLAAVACDDNLAEPNAARRTEFVVDAGTEAGQAERADAATSWARSRCTRTFGTVTSIRQGRVAFRHVSDEFSVDSPGTASLHTTGMPDRACCSQPHLVWYTPLMPVEDRRVGNTTVAQYDSGRVGDSWQRSDENSAFYGTFRN